MIIDTRRGCIDCGHGPIVTMVCDTCCQRRVQRDGEHWFKTLCADFDIKHPGLAAEKERKARQRTTRAKREAVIGWNNEVLREAS